MAEYKHGEMDITAQEHAFAGFIKLVTRGSIVCLVLLVFIALVNG